MAESVADREWKRISIATSASQALVLADEHIQAINDQVDAEAYTAIANGTFTPEQALLAYGRKQGLSMLRSRLKIQEHAGQRAARQQVNRRSVEDILNAARQLAD